MQISRFFSIFKIHQMYPKYIQCILNTAKVSRMQQMYSKYNKFIQLQQMYPNYSKCIQNTTNLSKNSRCIQTTANVSKIQQMYQIHQMSQNTAEASRMQQMCPKYRKCIQMHQMYPKYIKCIHNCSLCSWKFFQYCRSAVFDMRPRYVPSISSRIRSWAIRPAASGTLTPSVTSTISTAIGTVSRPSSITIRAAGG